MMLTEAYGETSLPRRGKILVTVDRVFLESPEKTSEYLRRHGHELILVRSGKADPMAANLHHLAQIMTKLGI